MEKYVVSRELAEKLKTAKFPQNTQFCWYKMQTLPKSRKLTPVVIAKERLLPEPEKRSNYIAATPLTDELLEQLPDSLRINNIVYQRYIYQSAAGLHCVKYEPIQEDILVTEGSSKLADALAKTWLWCKQNGYITN